MQHTAREVVFFEFYIIFDDVDRLFYYYLSLLTLFAIIMKRFLTLALTLAALAVSCKKDIDYKAPSVSIKAGAVTESSVAFTINATDAEVLAYIIDADGKEYAAAEILTQGQTSENGKETVVTGLEPSTTYKVFAAASGKGGESNVATLDIKTSDPEQKPSPSVKISTIETTSTSVTFTITTTQSKQAGYIILSQGEAPSASKIISEGTKINVPEQTVTEDGLSADTKYTVYAASHADGIYSEVASIEISTLPHENDGPIELNTQVEAKYLGDTHKNGNGEYRFTVSDGKSSGCSMTFSLFQLPPYDPDKDIDLPTRTYEYSTTFGMNTFDPENTFCMLETGHKTTFKDGKVTVEKSGLQYTITAEMTTTDDKDFKATYIGYLTFTNESESIPGLPRTDCDLTELNFIKGIAKYYSYNDRFDNCIVHLYDVEPRISGSSDFLFSEGHMLCLDLTTAISEEMVLDEGTYKVSASIGKDPLTFGKGYEYEFMGSALAMGTYIEKMDSNLDSAYGFISEGEVTISRNGTAYSITAKLKDDKGYSISGTFEGEIQMIDIR